MCWSNRADCGIGGGRGVPVGRTGRLGLRDLSVTAGIGFTLVALRKTAVWLSHPRVLAAHSTGSRRSSAVDIRRIRAAVVAWAAVSVFAACSNC
jgi:hypothetical protein